MVSPIIISVSMEVLRTVPRPGTGNRTGPGLNEVGGHQTCCPEKRPSRDLICNRSRIHTGLWGNHRRSDDRWKCSRVPSSLFDPAYPLPALLANNYGEMMSIPLYNSALLLSALILLLVVSAFNLTAHLTLLRFERRYDRNGSDSESDEAWKITCKFRWSGVGKSHMNRRKFEETLAKGFMIGSLVLVLGILAAIVLSSFFGEHPPSALSMLIQTPKGGYYLGKGGGIANAIVGSLCLAFGASFLSLLLGLPIAFALQKEYLGRRLARITRLSLDILWGTPSIVYGAFGFIVMVYFRTQRLPARAESSP